MTPFIGEIRILPYTFSPLHWVPCNGGLLLIRDYQALYSIIGTTYGGDGRVTFGVPDLRGRVPVGAGQAPGLTNRPLGWLGGTETVTLTANQLPQHSHAMQASSDAATTASPVGALPATGTSFYRPADDPANLRAMNASALSGEGGGQAHANMAPFQAMQFCMSLTGIYPTFN